MSIYPRKRAAVCVPIVIADDGTPHLVFNVRASLYWNRGYFCFPGGSLDEGETGEQGAIRELIEENFPHGRIRPDDIRTLPLKVNPIPSGYGHEVDVVPVLLTMEQVRELEPNEEVSEIFFVPLANVMSDANRLMDTGKRRMLLLNAERLRSGASIEPIYHMGPEPDPRHDPRLLMTGRERGEWDKPSEPEHYNISEHIAGPTAYAALTVAKAIAELGGHHIGDRFNPKTIARGVRELIEWDYPNPHEAHNALMEFPHTLPGAGMQNAAEDIYRMIERIGPEGFVQYHETESIYTSTPERLHRMTQFLVHAYYSSGASAKEWHYATQPRLSSLQGPEALKNEFVAKTVEDFHFYHRGVIAEHLGAWLSAGYSIADIYYHTCSELYRHSQRNDLSWKDKKQLEIDSRVLSAVCTRLKAAELLSELEPANAAERLRNQFRHWPVGFLKRIIEFGEVESRFVQDDSFERHVAQLAPHVQEGFAQLRDYAASAGELVHHRLRMARALDGSGDQLWNPNDGLFRDGDFDGMSRAMDNGLIKPYNLQQAFANHMPFSLQERRTRHR